MVQLLLSDYTKYSLQFDVKKHFQFHPKGLVVDHKREIVYY